MSGKLTFNSRSNFGTAQEKDVEFSIPFLTQPLHSQRDSKESQNLQVAFQGKERRRGKKKKDHTLLTTNFLLYPQQPVTYDSCLSPFGLSQSDSEDQAQF